MMARSVPVRRPRADMRAELAQLTGGPGPFVSVYLDVTPGSPRDSARERLARGFDAVPDPSAGQRELLAGDLLGLPVPDGQGAVPLIQGICQQSHTALLILVAP
jgi:hypothetical protein